MRRRKTDRHVRHNTPLAYRALLSMDWADPSVGLGWVQFFLLVVGLVGLGQSADGLGWIGSHKMDPWTTPDGVVAGGASIWRRKSSIYRRSSRLRWQGGGALTSAITRQICCSPAISRFQPTTSNFSYLIRVENRPVHRGPDPPSRNTTDIYPRPFSPTDIRSLPPTENHIRGHLPLARVGVYIYRVTV